jgi:4,5-dihydroxyphthalate decarboxylase
VAANSRTRLFTLLGDYPNTAAIRQGKIHSDLVEFEFSDIKVPNNGFKPLVRDHKFDAGELAIVTYLQAKEFNKPYVMLPAVVVARAQHHTIAYNSERGALRPSDLAGKRVGVRAYSVTTGVWVRGVLAKQYGLNLDKVHWVTFEDPHVAEYSDPPQVERAPADKNLVQMLLDGELDAAVVGDKLPDPRLKTLIPEADGAAREWAAQFGNPINHMLVVRKELSSSRPDLVRELFRIFKESRDAAVRDGNKNAAQLSFGIEANRTALETIIGIAFDQKLISRRFGVEELFDDVTGSLT